MPTEAVRDPHAALALSITNRRRCGSRGGERVACDATTIHSPSRRMNKSVNRSTTVSAGSEALVAVVWPVTTAASPNVGTQKAGDTLG